MVRLMYTAIMPGKKKNAAAVYFGRIGGSTPTKKKKGFAAITPARLKEIIAEREKRLREETRKKQPGVKVQ